jgi:tetratricopeptide (TPR) repeat protein
MKRSAEIQAALALDDLERTDEALQHLDALLERDANDMDVLVTRGNILRGKKRFDEANVAYDRAIATVGQVERRHWTLFYFRGITFERTRRWPQAEADFQRALELMPDQPLVLNYLGYSWVDQGVHLDRAMAILKRAAELRPEDGYIIDSVGWAYYRLGRFEEAVTWLERAIERKPADPVINDHLGDAYWQVGRRLEAYFQWRHARDSKPEPDDLVRIERKIREGLVDPAPTPPAAAVRPAQPAPGAAGGQGQGG